MPKPQFPDQVPLWILFVAIAVALGLTVEMGFMLAGRPPAKGSAFQAQVGVIVAAAFGLAGFLLGLTFQMATTRYEQRRSLMLDEANAIGTTYLRAGFLPEDQRAEVRRLLREYVDLRVAWGQGQSKDDAIARSKDLQGQLWAHAEASAKESPATPIFISLFVQSLNQTIDLQNSRLTVANLRRIKPAMWITFYVITFGSMFVLGYNGGALNVRARVAVFALTTAFALLLCLITDLDRPEMNLFALDQQVFVELKASMNMP